MERNDPWKIAAARRLRRDATDAERKLWYHLRRFPQAHWRRQRLVLSYILDYSHVAKLCVELDGGQHFEPPGAESDRLRDQELAIVEIKVLRFDDVTLLRETREVVEEIWRVWRERAECSPPP